MAKTASNQLGICLRIMHVRRIPKVSMYMAVTTKIVPKKAQKWPKMARFWPKWRYNGRVMAREVSFYQCLWVTKSYAKFGCSRTPRTASVHNSFIVLRCMWKESAPLGHYNILIDFRGGGYIVKITTSIVKMAADELKPAYRQTLELDSADGLELYWWR